MLEILIIDKKNGELVASILQPTKDTESNSYLLRCLNLTKTYNNVNAINLLTCQIETNALGLFGPNGSGKTTLINLMTKMVLPTAGNVDLGVPREHVRFIPDFPNLPQMFTVDQWLGTLETIYGDVELNVDIQELTKLEGELKLKDLSAGQYRLASLLPVFHGKPQLIILDEPTNFLDTVIRDKIIELLQEQIKKTKTKIILASHRLDEIAAFSDKVLLLDKGKMLAETSMNLENRETYSIRVDKMEEFMKLLDGSNIEFKKQRTMLGDELLLNMSWNFWKVVHKFTKSEGVIYSLNIVNEFESTLSEL